MLFVSVMHGQTNIRYIYNLRCTQTLVHSLGGYPTKDRDMSEF